MTATNVVALPASGQAYPAAQLALIRRTVAADCNNDEFDLFIAAAKRTGLDPFLKQIRAIVFNKNKPEKRRMAIIPGIDGLRVIAARSGRYRPDEDEPEYVSSPELKSDTNPLGLERAVVRIWIADAMKAGGWKRVTGVAYWDEFAPIADEWKEDEQTGRRRPTGRKVLDTGGNWGRMPRIMLAKCAEAQALRRAFPEDLSGLYEGAELDQARAGELLPSEAVGAALTEERMAKVGGAGIHFQFDPHQPLETVPLGQVADRVMAFAHDVGGLAKLRWFESVNIQPLREFWARSPGDALEVKAALEKRARELEAAEQTGAA